jgi:hypothetical protein
VILLSPLLPGAPRSLSSGYVNLSHHVLCALNSTCVRLALSPTLRWLIVTNVRDLYLSTSLHFYLSTFNYHFAMSSRSSLLGFPSLLQTRSGSENGRRRLVIYWSPHPHVLAVSVKHEDLQPVSYFAVSL